VGLLTPHWLYSPFISAGQKQLVAMVSGGTAGLLCFIGLSLLLHRRIFDPRIRLTSHRTDLAILVILWVQLCLGLVTLPFSWHHRDGGTMMVLAEWAQNIATFRPDAALMAGIDWPFKVHMVLGMTIFLLFPFSRLVHVWSGLATVGYAFRPYQLVRSRRLNVPRRGACLSAWSLTMTDRSPRILPRVNGVPLVNADEAVALDEAHPAPARLHRAAAPGRPGGRPAGGRRPGPEQGAISPAAADAIEALLDQALVCPEPTEEACRRHFAAHAGRYAVGEKVQARHVLFAVTPGVDVNALRQRAEACLLDLRCGRTARPTASPRWRPAPPTAPAAPRAAPWAGCARRTAPRVRPRALRPAEVGVLPRLVHSRFGLHVVEVLAREPGTQPDFEVVRSAVAQSLRQQSYATALRQYLSLLAGQSRVEGIDLDAADTPLVQ
jgi:respiratory nitrate reductase gamma subunit